MNLPNCYRCGSQPCQCGATLYQGDVREVLGQMEAGSVHCCVTSPPYWGLRDYGTAEWEGGDGGCDHKPPDEAGKTNKPSDGQREHAGRFSGPTCHKCGARRIDNQLGLEATPELFVANMVDVFRGVWRVLRDDGVLFVNLGDSYNSGTTAPSQPSGGTDVGGHTARSGDAIGSRRVNAPGLKPKDLCGIPWRVALALQADGWYLRQDIIWAKPNPMPESVTDRCTKSHEYLFLLTKSPRYYYDAEAIKEPATYAGKVVTLGEKSLSRGQATGMGVDPSGNGKAASVVVAAGRNRRSVWTIPTQSYKFAHFATFPTALVEPCVLAGTSEEGCCPECGAPWERVVEKDGPTSWEARKASGSTSGNREIGRIENQGPCVSHMAPKNAASTGGFGWVPPTTTTGWQPTCKCPNHKPVPCTVLDIFCGSGTSMQVARDKGCHAIGIELSPEYCELIVERLRQNVLF